MPLSRAPVRALLFTLVWLSCAWFGSWELNPNNATRLFAALSIVEDGDATIDEFAALTIDKASFDGHAFLDKAPGVTLMALPAVALADWWTGETAHNQRLAWDDPLLARFLKLRTRIAAATGAAVLTAFAAVALFELGVAVGGTVAAGLVAALGYALGSTAWGWSTTLFGHAPVAALLLIATWAVHRGTAGGRAWPHAALAGAALGWALVVEHSALLPGLPIGLLALWRMRGWPRDRALPAIAVALAAGTAALLPMLWYNLLAFGTPFRLGYQGVVGWEGMNQGLFGLTYPRPGVLWEVLVGRYRGMLWVAPLLALGAWGLFAGRRGPARDLLLTAMAVAGVAFLYNASYFYWDGGNATGPRHAVPATGFLALGLAAAWRDAGRIGRGVIAALLPVSAAINCVIAAAEITAPAGIPFALRDAVWRGRFVTGQLRTVPDEWFGWTPFAGLWIYLAVAVPLLAALLAVARRQHTSR